MDIYGFLHYSYKIIRYSGYSNQLPLSAHIFSIHWGPLSFGNLSDYYKNSK